jgi:dihydrofolate synthase/folylpolyglutamate synthase
VQLPGRFQVLPGRPAIVLDVAHNPHAAAVLAHNLDMIGFYPQTHAVFGMLNDKDVVGVVAKVGARIDHWHIAPTPGARGASAASIARHVSAAIPGASVTEHPTFAAALASAHERANADDRILAFGSFVCVAEVMRVIAGTTETFEIAAPPATQSH